MRKLGLIVALCFLLSAYAQSEDNTGVELIGPVQERSQYMAVVTGFPFLGVHYGLENSLGDNADIRFRLGLNPFGAFGFQGGVDALFDVGALGNNQVYAGGGPGASYNGGFSYASWSVDLTGTLGIRWPINEGISLIGEGSVGIGFYTSSGLGESFSSLDAAARVAFGLQFGL